MSNQEYIKIEGAYENNLKHISLDIPKKQITIFTGVSGSGKSSLVLDTIAASSRRELNETFPSFVQQYLPKYGRPHVDRIGNLPVAIVIDQRKPAPNARSTVGTYTDIYSLLRLLFSRVGKPFVGYSDTFSFNHPQGRCTRCDGLGEIRELDVHKLVDLGYLHLNQALSTLSGGELQRVKLASYLGTQSKVFVLDEPTDGLHVKDIRHIISLFDSMVDQGNSVFLIEHNLDVIKTADYIIDMGPKAGRLGGEVVFQGTPEEMLKQDTLTSRYLNRTCSIQIPGQRRKGNGHSLWLRGARGNNLKGVDVEFPLGQLICITGVSGSGKSTLINDTLQPILSQHFYRSLRDPLPYDKVEGLEFVDKVVSVDQSPIGRLPRSNPATYTGVFNDIRALFVSLPEAKIRGYKPGRFSFNVKGGRCEACGGNGYKTIEMNFLPDVYVHCEACDGKRYNKETLEVRYKGKSIGDVLNLTINQAVEFFENLPHLQSKLKMLQDVGLGYIKIGQPCTTLSGGESQRIKLATELSKKDTGSTLYILDEPTTGLHFEDINILLGVLQKLVDKGNTVIVIEHNLDVIKVADYLIDMGPGGGKMGGTVVCTGTPEEVAQNKKSVTAPFLREELGMK